MNTPSTDPIFDEAAMLLDAAHADRMYRDSRIMPMTAEVFNDPTDIAYWASQRS